MPIRDYSYMHDAGPTGILLIHGLAGNPSEVRYVANRLIGAGHTVHCCQLAGHGGDEKDLKSSRWTDWTAVVEEALHGLRERCQFVVAGGLSMGAVLALNLAASRPASVDALALYSPTIRYDGWAMPWYSFLVRLLKDTPVRHFAGIGDRPPHGIKNERVRG